MSQKASRKGVVNEEKEKAETPVKDMKKKMAANAEKEKLTAEKKEAEKPEKSTDKSEKVEKAVEKKNDKAAEKKNDKAAEKKTEKSAEKKTDAPVEKKEESKEDKSGKSDKPDQRKPDRKQNGKDTRPANGTANGDENGTVSAPDDDDEDIMIIDEAEHDDMFPELAYDDTSDLEFEPPTPDAAGRSFTRRSQAKATRTPETPRPASDKQPEREPADDSKESKVLKLKEDAPASSERKLRSADSPKPEKKQEKPTEAKKDSPKKQDKEKEEEKENGGKQEKTDVVIEIEAADDAPRKPDTNYSKSRVKVSPYRRSGRLADHTASSLVANYTGNNTTMEMDITETTSSFAEDPSLDDSSYLSGLRSIRGRRSYKPLADMPPRRAPAPKPASTEQPSRPTAPVVGRKRKPEADDTIELGVEASTLHSHGKRSRLLDRITHSFRRAAASTPLPPEIVGINTDLPLTAPVAHPDPEALKSDAPAAVPLAPAAVPLEGDRDAKRCIVM